MEEQNEIDQMGKEKVCNLKIILCLQYISMKSSVYWEKALSSGDSACFYLFYKDTHTFSVGIKESFAHAEIT